MNKKKKAKRMNMEWQFRRVEVILNRGRHTNSMSEQNERKREREAAWDGSNEILYAKKILSTFNYWRESHSVSSSGRRQQNIQIPWTAPSEDFIFDIDLIPTVLTGIFILKFLCFSTR